MKGYAALLVCVGCNVTPIGTTGGVALPDRGDCPRGTAVVSSDFQSSEIAILDPSAQVRSAAFLSSASAPASSLAAPLSGDVGVEPARSRPGELAIIDRFGTNVLTFVDTRTAAVRAQLPLGTGFEANVQDYLEVDEHLAFVPRLGDNASPGREPFDAGSDLLLIDPSVPSILASLPLPRRAGYLPNPAAIGRVAGDVLVTLEHARSNYSGMADSEIVAVSVEKPHVRYRLPLPGLKNCGRVEVSPSGAVLAVACSAYITRRGDVPEPEASGLILLDATQDPPAELKRFSALELVQSPLQSSLEFVSERLVLLKTQTALGADQDNRLFSLDLENGDVQLLSTAARGANGQGYGIAFGGMTCSAGCGDPCLVADGSRGKLLRFDVKPDKLEAAGDVSIGGAGLPPIAVTPFW